MKNEREMSLEDSLQFVKIKVRKYTFEVLKRLAKEDEIEVFEEVQNLVADEEYRRQAY